MKIEILLLVLIVFITSCSMKKKNNTPMKKNEENSRYRTAKFIVEDSLFIIPQYINTNINCINRAPISEPQKLLPQITTSYFSEYSSIYFFTVITPKQIIFETYNDTGTPKPNLIFYVDDIKYSEYKRIFDYFKKDKNYNDLTYTHDSGQNIMIKDKEKNDFGNMWGGDKYPLTKLESEWLVKRHLEYFGQIGKFNIEFNKELLKPVFYNLCNYEKEFTHWKELYPEIQNHELNY